MKNIKFLNRILDQSSGSILIIVLSLFLSGITTTDINCAEWKSVIFGQTTYAERNSIEVDGVSKTVTLNAGTKDGSVVGGKVANAHDGISYYYTEITPDKNFVITAKIKVNYFAKEKPDNQEAFGIMARDAIGKNLDNSVFASNMVLVGGYRGNIQSVYRDKVNDRSGTGALRYDIFKFGNRPPNDGTAIYTLTMKKTNTGYHVSVNNSEEKIYYRPKGFEVQDKAKIYVGFFAARVASITVSDIKFTTSNVAADPPGEPEPIKKIIATVNAVSPKTASMPDYNLNVSTNVEGKINIKFNDSVSTINAYPPGIYKKNFSIAKGENVFEIQLVPDDKSLEAVNIKHTVVYKTYGKNGGTIYVSPSGKETAEGTSKDPLDIYTAVDFVMPGQTVLLSDGTYKMVRTLVIEKGNNGEKGKLKTLKGAKNVVLDFEKKNNGVIIDGNRWKIYNINITKSALHGMKISGNYNIIEKVNTFFNGETGLQISGLAVDTIDQWPSYNLILNCESYDNRDLSENNADGFAAKVTCGPGNVFRGCIAHNNCDDGYDLYAKLETGPIGEVTVENCIAYSNGIMSDGYKTTGDGNGFKLGGEGIAVKHVLRNSLSFNNRMSGISNNSNPAVIIENNTSADNGSLNYHIFIYSNSIPQLTVRNNISFRTTDGKDDTILNSLKSADNYFLIGKTSANSEGGKIVKDDFKSIEQDKFKRSMNGNIKPFPFMMIKSSKIKSGAKLNDFSNITIIEDK